jgi:hypothetical protein
MLIYGGQRGSSRLGDLWALDLSGDSWSELTAATTPPGRTFAASIYETLSNRFVLYGGDTGGEKSAEVWAFDLAENSWSSLEINGAAARRRGGAAARRLSISNPRIAYSILVARR